MVLNTELKTNNDFECQTKDMALNANLNNGSERQTEDAALNAKLRGKVERGYALMWHVATTLDPQITKLEEVL